MRYKVILKTTNRYENRVQLCLNTWLKDLDYVCLTDKPTGKFNEIQGSERQDYHSAEEKTVFMMNHIKDSDEYNEYDWLVFIDDDAILNTKMFEFIAPHFDKNKLYGLIIGGCPKEPSLEFPSGGASYMVSPSLIKQVGRMKDREWGLEDVSVGKWMKEENIEYSDSFVIGDSKYYLRLNGWFPFTDESRDFPPELVNDRAKYASAIFERVTEAKRESLLSHMTHHYIKDAEFMYYLHELYSNWTTEDMKLYRIA